MRYCLASQRLLQGERVGLMYRERPFGVEDSGWRFFVGDESGEYTANPRNVLMTPLPTLVNLHPELAQWLDQPEGAALERDSQGALKPCS